MKKYFSTPVVCTVGLIITLFILVVAFKGSNVNGHQRGGLFVPRSVLPPPSPLIIDSLVLSLFLRKLEASEIIKSEVRLFYANRGLQAAWISEKGINAAASAFYGQIKGDSKDFADRTLDNLVLDSMFQEMSSTSNLLHISINRREQFELFLTSSFFTYVRRMVGGITTESKETQWHITRRKINYQLIISGLASLPPGTTHQLPFNDNYLRLREQLSALRIMERSGGMPLLLTHKAVLVPGNKDSCLISAKYHLYLTGDWLIRDSTILFTDSLMVAVKRYQKRMGLTINGKIDLPTIREINKPIHDRIGQIMVNLERLRWVPAKMEGDYLLVNIPEFRLHVFEDHVQVWSTNVVVGKAMRRTSIFHNNISQIIFNPYWDVPESITQKEILKHMKNDPGYLAKNNMEVVSHQPFSVRQKPGSTNALGRVKFLFPNSYNIYLHDTPTKQLFKETSRAFSHGCIRVEDPMWLARYLLRKYPLWTVERMDSILKTNKAFPVKVNPAEPVYIAYFTAWVDGEGQLNFRKDVYGLDKKLARDLIPFTKQ